MRRKVTSISIFIVFLVLSLTGVLLYIKPFSPVVAALHILMGFLFLIGIVFHVFNNYIPLSKYFKSKSKYRIFFMSRTFVALGLFILISLMALKIGIPPFSKIMPLKKTLQGDTEVYYKKMVTNKDLTGGDVTVEVLYDQPLKTPTVAIWVEDSKGNYLQDLYVSEKLAKEGFVNFENKTKRPEALPVWTHKRAIKDESGLYTPSKQNPVPDGMSGATPQTSYVLDTHFASKTPDSIRVFLEVNQSYDWNEFYHDKAFPNDTIYSGPGMVGQPALVYATNLFAKSGSTIQKMKLIGRSHHSGKNGTIYTDLENLTTALKIVKRILVEIN